MNTYLDFEKPLAELEGKIRELEHAADANNEVDIVEELTRLKAKAEQMLTATYAKLSAWQKVQVARHPDRPHFQDYVAGLVENFTPLAGDRLFGDDKAIVGGLGRFHGRSVMLLGHEKGRGTDGRVTHNFGMARPEGYRKAVRLMQLADKFHLPVITLVDTPGAFPGADAEARGVAEAIARGIEACLDLRVPLIAAIVGEGGSGGAVAIATANRVIMLEHAVYTVATPEACASILWHAADKAPEAAEALKITARDLLRLKLIDKIVAEPVGGAHRAPEATVAAVGQAIEEALKALAATEPGVLREARRRKYLDMGRDL
ncbi:MAG TPA: acetyl-CoA carboxylase carboxyltransferase subunit alpha [Candidatus Sulfotelmatobacter sp.]|nr:acetyl-CoA carboxylase carboxyltransferase subunit alpha [Candidatus Sulfotelmatobacter sp.]